MAHAFSPSIGKAEGNLRSRTVWITKMESGSRQGHRADLQPAHQAVLGLHILLCTRTHIHTNTPESAIPLFQHSEGKGSCQGLQFFGLQSELQAAKLNSKTPILLIYNQCATSQSPHFHSLSRHFPSPSPRVWSSPDPGTSSL